MCVRVRMRVREKEGVKRKNEFNSRIVSDEANLQFQYEDMFD